MARYTAAALLALSLLACSLSAASAQAGVQPGPLCAAGTLAPGGWAPLEQPAAAGGAQAALPLDVALLGLVEWSLGAANASAAAGGDSLLPCVADDDSATLAACTRVLGDAGPQELLVWANLTCPQPEAGAVSLRLNATLAQPLPPGGAWETALANLDEVEVEVLSVDGEEAAPSGAPPPTVVVAAPGPATAGGPSIYGTPTPRAAVAPGTPFTEPLPAGPAWVRGPNATGEGQWATYSVEQWQENVATVSAANASSTHFDYVQFGDSLTKHLARTAGLRIWEATFSEANGYGPTAPLGVVGNDIADLMWRLVVGGEVPAVGPKVASVWIGINELSVDETPQSSAQRYAFLLDWLAAALPGTRLMAIAVLPNASKDVVPLNEAYAAVAAARDIPFVRCAQDINPNDTAVLYDGIHATPATQQIFLDCLAPQVRTQLEAANAAA